MSHKYLLTLTLIAISSYVYGQKPIQTSTIGPSIGIHAREKFDTLNFEKSKKKFINTPATDGTVYIDFVGTGDIQKSISQGSDINANTGLGVIFEKYNPRTSFIQSFNLEGMINVASTSDTINARLVNGILENRRDFGAYILNPISSKQSFYLNTSAYFGFSATNDTWRDRIFSIINGFSLRVISSNNVWKYNNNRIANLGVLYYRLGFFHDFVPDNYRSGTRTDPNIDGSERINFSIFAGIFYSKRTIIGDLTSSSNEQLRNDFLGSSDTKFKGLEFNFGFRLKSILAEFQMPVLSSGKTSIQGLTNTQFIFSIKFVGGFGLKLNKSG